MIDDNESVREGVAAIVRKEGYDCLVASSGPEGLALFKEHRPDFVISDLKMEGMDGIEVLQAIKDSDPDALIMLITAYGTVQTAVTAMKLGAFDFLTKPFSPQVLRLKLKAAAHYLDMAEERNRLESENEYLRREVQGAIGARRLIGRSPAFTRVMDLVSRVARTDSSVLVLGESGTGKELVAEAIHEHSPRRGGPFIKVNCGALTETLLESELFGHEKGAFTGAIKRKIGRFELANHGTIFLDEIGDVSPALQLKLLRVLQERTFERVGGEKTIQVDVRVISATNRDLEAMVREGAFREDLFYRLHIVPIHLPPLRERREDIPLLVTHFVDKLRNRTRSRVTGFSDQAMEALLEYDWPGNVRELENVVEQILVFAQGEVVGVEDLPPAIRKASSPLSGGVGLDDLEGRSLPELLKDIERRIISEAYRRAGGVKTETARLLGIKTSALYYKLNAYGLVDEPQGDGGASNN